MQTELEKQRKTQTALDTERRLMASALARLAEGPQTRRKKDQQTRLVFGLDLTASREASLLQARIATASMFDAVRSLGPIALRLIYFRGTRECRQTAWQDDPGKLSQSMHRLSCESGYTQILRAMRCVLAETNKISAFIYVGDHCEEKELKLLELARQFGQKQIPIFLFHECADDNDAALEAKPIFKQMAEVSGGAYVEFKPDSGEALREMLSSVAAFSSSGYEGIAHLAAPVTQEGRQLQERMKLMLGTGA